MSAVAEPFLEAVVEDEPTEETRYGIYVLGERPCEFCKGTGYRKPIPAKDDPQFEPCHRCGGSGSRPAPERVAETSKEGIGPALVQLAEDGRDAGETETPMFGILDQIERRWISGLWPKASS